VEEKRIVEAMDNLSLGVLMRRFNKVSPSSLYTNEQKAREGRKEAGRMISLLASVLLLLTLLF